MDGSCATSSRSGKSDRRVAGRAWNAVHVAAVCCGVLLTGCARDAASHRLVKVGIAHPPGHSFALALGRFAEAVQSATDGRLEVRVYASAQLGGEREMQEMLTLGSLEMSVTGVLNIYEPLFAVFELPFLYTDRDHVVRVMTDLPERDVAQRLTRQGLRVLGFYENGFRNITNSRRPIDSPDDLRGLIIRTPENLAQFETFKAWRPCPPR